MDEVLLHKRLYYPRVSEVYEMYTSLNYGFINPDVLKRAAERGTRVHVYCTAFIKGYAWAKEIDPECSPYVESFIQWYQKEVDRVFLLPIRLYDDEKQFSGEVDLVVKLKNRDDLMLIDLKTPVSVQKSWQVQLAAYLHLLKVNGYNVSSAMNLRLRNAGSYPLKTDYEDCKEGWKIFSNCLDNYNYFIRKKDIGVEDAVD